MLSISAKDFLNNLVLNNQSSTFGKGSLWKENSTTEHILKAAALGIVVMAVYFLLSALIPEALHTRKHKNTVGVNKSMFLLHGSVAVCFFLGAILMIMVGSALTAAKVATVDFPLTGVIFAICNGCGMVSTFYILMLKLKHEKAAQALGISEYDYYKDYISKGRE